MRIRTNQLGFSVIELVIILLVVSIVGVSGYKVYNRNKSKTTSSDSSQTINSSAKANDVSKAPSIVKTTGDLDKSTKALDATDPSGSNSIDTAQLDSQMAAF